MWLGDLSLHVCLSGQLPYFSISYRKTTTKKILTYFRNNGAVPNIFTREGGQSQLWTFNNDGTIAAYDGRMCLDVKGGAGEDVQVWECSGGDSQRWERFKELGIKWVNSNRCLENIPGGTVKLRDCDK